MKEALNKYRFLSLNHIKSVYSSASITAIDVLLFNPEIQGKQIFAYPNPLLFFVSNQLIFLSP